MTAIRRVSWTRAAVALLAAVVLCAPQAAAMGLKDEQELGARFALEARRRLPLLRAPALSAYLRRIGERIIARLDAKEFDYRFYVVRESTLNAFAVPGGYVYVHAGLLDQVTDEAELAGVLAHEIVHVHAHHVVRQEEQTALINYATILGLFLSAVHPALGAGAASAGAAAQLKYARQYEQEADHVGLGLMRDAGFDPLGMPRFLRMVLKAQQLNPAEVPPYFLSHPLTEDRITELEQLARAMPHPRARTGSDAELAAAQATVRALVEPREKVVAAYEKRLARDPNSVAAKHQLGLVLLETGQPERAEPLLAAAADGGAPRARGDYGRALARQGEFITARVAFAAHLREYPDDPPIMVELARTMMAANSSKRPREGDAAGEIKAAAALLENALAREPELDDAEYALAECRGKSGDDRQQWWHLARAFELRGEYDRASSAYEKARDLAPKDTPERKDAEEALKALRSVL
jgi:predicted Zn-dependent protease